ncbi:MAG: four helix bundle protein [Candidatus Acetothermia bacterium]|nr:four helix bundle protein [Candidatus Acetothermia bacterium]
MAIERFEDIEAWKAARSLAGSVYAVSKKTDLAKDFGLKDQLQRAAVSIMANIAEGFDSRSDQEFIRFLSYAFRSASELQSHLYIALDQGYVSQEQFDQLYTEAVGVKKLLNGFIRYLQSKLRSRCGPRTTHHAPRTKGDEACTFPFLT